MEALPEIDEVRSITRRLRAYVEQESLKCSFVSIADEVGIHEKTARLIFREYLTRQGQEVKSDPQTLGCEGSNRSREGNEQTLRTASLVPLSRGRAEHAAEPCYGCAEGAIRDCLPAG